MQIAAFLFARLTTGAPFRRRVPAAVGSISLAALLVPVACAVPNASTPASSGHPIVLQVRGKSYAWAFAARAPVFVGAGDGFLQVFDAHSGAIEATLPGRPLYSTALARTIALSPDGRILAATDGEQGELRFIDVASGATKVRIRRATGDLDALGFSPDGRVFALYRREVPSGIPFIDLIDVRTATTVRTLANVDDAAAFAPDDRTVAVVDDRHTEIRIESLHSGAIRKRLRGPAGVYGPLAFSPDGTHLASVGDDAGRPPKRDGSFELCGYARPAFVDLFDLDKYVRQLPDGMAWGQCDAPRTSGTLAFPDDRHIASQAPVGVSLIRELGGRQIGASLIGPVARSDRGVLVRNDAAFTRIDGTTVRHLAQLPTRMHPPDSLAVSQTGLLAAAYGTSCIVWNLASGPSARSIAVTDPDHMQTHSMSFLDDGSISVSRAGDALVIDANSGATIRRVQPAADVIYVYGAPDVRVLGNGRTALWSDRGIVAAFDLQTLAPIGTIPGIAAIPNVVASDGRVFAEITGGSYPDLVLGDIGTRRVLHRIPNVGSSVALSRDGRVGAVFAKEDAGFLIFDPTTGTVSQTIVQPISELSDRIAVAPDGRTVALYAQSGSFLYDAASGRRLRTLDATPGTTGGDVLFTANGAALVFARADGSLALRSISDGRLVATLVAIPRTRVLDWIIVLPQGPYAASPGARSLVRVRVAQQRHSPSIGVAAREDMHAVLRALAPFF